MKNPFARLLGGAPPRQMAFCHTCRLHHASPQGTQEALEFALRHRVHNVEIVNLMPRRRAFLAGAAAVALDWLLPPAYAQLGYPGNASVKQAVGTATAFTKTNANLATSATAGWMSNAIDNTTNLYLDAIVGIELAAVNTAPANSKAIFLYAYGLVNSAGTAYTSAGDGTPSGSEGTLTFADVTANSIPMPILGVVPYPVQNKAINGGPFSVRRALGVLPPKWGVAMINHSGMTLSVTNIYYQEQYFTVA